MVFCDAGPGWAIRPETMGWCETWPLPSSYDPARAQDLCSGILSLIRRTRNGLLDRFPSDLISETCQ